MARMPSAERRRQLTEAAIRAMTRDGVARTTTRSIAAEAGVSLSVFHYCFDSKQALLESVITTIADHSVSLAKEAIRPRATLRETVRAGFQAYWDHVVAHPEEHMLTYELTQYALRQPGSSTWLAGSTSCTPRPTPSSSSSCGAAGTSSSACPFRCWPAIWPR